MALILFNVTHQTIDIIKWHGLTSVALILVLLIFGCTGLLIKLSFVNFIAFGGFGSPVNRPINNLILIDQVSDYRRAKRELF